MFSIDDLLDALIKACLTCILFILTIGLIYAGVHDFDQDCRDQFGATYYHVSVSEGADFCTSGQDIKYLHTK